MANKRAIIIVLDSFGIGALPDAKKFGDAGSNTLGHIDDYATQNKLSFDIPNLLKLGLGRAYTKVNNKKLACDNNNYALNGFYGACQEQSTGKDTTSGHWEIAGCPVLFDWGYFTNLENSFPQKLLDSIVEKSGVKGYLGNCHASGTDIIRDLGDEHVKSGKPIFYTSADSVFQIACHEQYFGLQNLYKLCEIAREELAPYNIARVIARPFTGDSPAAYERTGNRKDYSVLPSSKTLLDICSDNGGQVISIGKIGDIYAHQGTGIEIKATGLAELCEKTINAINEHKEDKTFIMTNLVDFDMVYGHRRNTVGYKEALEYFDSYLPEIIATLTPDDILILTADHGCDPTWPGSDHTREHIPFLMYHNGKSGEIGICKTYSDIGQTVAKHLNLPKLANGVAVEHG
ncbi:MAG: phosphopentomutase [Burkholderiales bacterium]|jgi:phosphopentomutase|nr:phosphopentomutase [Burkholderiales bacterium]